MRIEMNAIYHLPTQAHEDDFLKQAKKQGLTWDFGQKATTNKQWEGYKEDYCIRVESGQLGGFSEKSWYKIASSLPIIAWKIGYTKADMQIGQIYKTRDGEVHQWTRSDVQDVRWHNEYNRPLNDDIIEVYPFPLISLWKRPEPKYRVKTELTKEQAEKLGLEFCEVVE